MVGDTGRGADRKDFVSVEANLHPVPGIRYRV